MSNISISISFSISGSKVVSIFAIGGLSTVIGQAIKAFQGPSPSPTPSPIRQQRLQLRGPIRDKPRPFPRKPRLQDKPRVFQLCFRDWQCHSEACQFRPHPPLATLILATRLIQAIPTPGFTDCTWVATLIVATPGPHFCRLYYPFKWHPQIIPYPKCGPYFFRPHPRSRQHCFKPCPWSRPYFFKPHSRSRPHLFRPHPWSRPLFFKPHLVRPHPEASHTSLSHIPL